MRESGNSWIGFAAAVILTFAIAALLSVAKEKPIKKSDLPPAVQKTADEESKGAQVRGYSAEMENGHRVYELELTVNGHSRDVTMASDGRVLKVEEQVEFDHLGPGVRTALQKKAGAGKIRKVELLTRNGVPVAYEAQILHGSKRSEVKVGPDGNTLAHPE